MLQIGLGNKAKKANIGTALTTMLGFAYHPNSGLGNGAMENKNRLYSS